MKILLVEDDKFLRTLLEKRLKSENFEVEIAVDGEEALEKAASFLPSLILLDIILPKKSGFTFLEEIKKNENLKNIAVIILSNLGQNEDIEKGKTLGAIDYFIKASTSIEELVRKIKEILEKS